MASQEVLTSTSSSVPSDRSMKSCHPCFFRLAICLAVNGPPKCIQNARNSLMAGFLQPFGLPKVSVLVLGLDG